MKSWVLLRGLMREKRHWGVFADLLQQKYPADQILMVDWPGNGELHQQTSLHRISDMVQHLQSTLTQKGCCAPYHVIAVSLGAMVAIEWMRQSPQDIASATLINTSLRPINPFYQRLMPHNYTQLLSMLFRTNAEQEQLILQLTSNQAHPATLQQWIAYQQQHPISKLNILRQLWAAATYRAPIETPQTALQLISSQHDRLVDQQCSLTLAQLWGVPHAVHPTAGHDLPLDDPQWLIEHLP
jgi:alpha-beta hydrolase superfamily lysophospholipase